jgi:hypothetical protein
MINYPQKVLMRYTEPSFSNRFSNMLENSNEYSGTLAGVWDTRNQLLDYTPNTSALGKVKPLEIRQQEQQIDILVSRLRSMGVSSTVIEAAHVYMYEDLSDPNLRDSVIMQARYSAILAQRLVHAGINVREMLFVDDYNPPNDGRQSNTNIDMGELVELVRSTGYNPELVLREASMATLAQEVIGIMQNKQRIVTSPEQEEDSDNTTQSINDLFLTRNKIELYRSSDDMVSCAMLDAALSLVKLTYMADTVINVLPRGAEGQGFSYKSQQKKMRTIIGEHLDARVLPIANLFVKSNESTAHITAGTHHTLRKPTVK